MLLLCALLSLTLICCLLTGQRFEKMITTITGAAILLCYVLAMSKQLPLFSWVVYALLAMLAGYLAYRIATHQTTVTAQEVFQTAVTPALLAFIALLVFYAATLNTHAVNATDDFNYWAVMVKSLYAQNGFVDSYHHLSPRFMSYTPGVQLFQWIGLAMAGEFSEGMLFIMLAVLNSIFLLPFGSVLTWKKAYYLPLYFVFLIAMPTLMFRDTYAMLRVDATLGLCLGCALCQAWDLARQPKAAWFDVLSLGLTLSTLALVKQIGIVWAVLPITLVLFLSQKVVRAPRKWLVPLAMVVFVWISWQVFTNIRQLNGVHETNLTGTLSDMAASTWQAPENLYLLPRALWGALTFADRATLVNSPTTALVYMPMLGWLLFSILAPLLLGAFARNDQATAYKRLSVWMLCGALLLFVGFTVIFLTAFAPEFNSFISDDYARLQYLLERYLGAFLLGGVLLCVHLAQGIKAPQAAKVPVAMCAMALLINWGQLAFHLNPYQYIPSEPTDVLIYEEENFWVSDVEALDQPNDAIILYGINPTPMHRERLQYAVAPVKIVTFYGDINTREFIDLLKNSHITHVICMDDCNPTYQVAVDFTEDGYMDTYTLYTVTWHDDTPMLVYE